MIKFFLKKNLCDGWDNLLQLFIYNIGLILWGGIIAFAWFETSPYLEAYNTLLPWVTLIAAISLFMIPVFAWGANAMKIADFNTPSAGLFFRSMRVVWKLAVAFSVLVTAVTFMALNAIPYYWTQFGWLGTLVAAAICWFLLISAIALQYFLPLYFLQEQNGFKKCLKKSFIIFFDNPMFSLFLFLYNGVLFMLSLVFVFIAPGVNGITLAAMNATRLRLYKYDWLDEHPGYINDRDKRANVPWNELIAQDKETLGPRKISSFLFPWK